MATTASKNLTILASVMEYSHVMVYMFYYNIIGAKARLKSRFQAGSEPALSLIPTLPYGPSATPAQGGSSRPACTCRRSPRATRRPS